jgi:Tol biopolymer transport system component
MLLERQGDVVTRDELRKALWPDQSWGDLDHRLNKTINRVRDALGDSATSPRFLETLPRIGYRFLVPVAALAPNADRVAPAEAPPSTVPVEPPRRAGWLHGWLLACVIGLSVAAGFAIPAAYRALEKKSAPFQQTLATTPLTTYVGSELYPSFSPDGSQVVFAWDGEAQSTFHLFVTSVNPGARRSLTGGAQRESSPVWSPDGRNIAFLREAGAGRGEIRLIRPDGSGDRKIAEVIPSRTDHPLAWTRDSHWLVVAANPPGDGPPALFLLSVDSSAMHRITSPPVQSAGDLSPAISPDGAALAFTRATSAVWRDIFVVSLSGDHEPTGDPVRVTDLHKVVDTLAWTADGRSLYFAASATLAGARFLYRVNSGPTRNTGFVETGIEGSHPSVSSANGSVVYVRPNIEQTSTWRIHVPSRGSAAPVQWSRLLSSTRRDFTVDISSEGRLVFSSVRSGPTEIWTSNLDGSDLKRVSSLGATPRWSPDARRIAYQSTENGRAEIYVIEVASGSVLRLSGGAGVDIYPSWSRDGRFLYFSSDRSGKPQIWKAPSGGGDARQITRTGGTYAVESFDGTTIYYTAPGQPASIRSAPAEGGPETLLIDGIVGLSSIAIAPEGLYYLSSLTSSQAKLDFYDFATRTSRRIAEIDRPVHNVLSSPPDGRSVVFTRIDRQDSDLMLLSVK